MSSDYKQVSPTNLQNNDTNSSEPTTENKDDKQVESNETKEKNQTTSRTSTPAITRSVSHSSNHNQSPKVTDATARNERPPSPNVRHRIVKQQTSNSISQQRTRSSSPRKTFSFLSPDRLNLRKWKQQRRELAKQEENDRIYHENRQKLERLAKIAKEPSSYPSINIEQERLRERHVMDHHRKVLKSYIPILHNNLYIVNRLANVKGVYDIKKMNEDYARHTQILKQDAANRRKARETAAQRPFILPKINTKS